MPCPPDARDPEAPLGSTLRDALDAQQGGSQAWWRLDERIRPWLATRLARGRRPPGIDLDDLVQEVILEVLRSFPHFETMPGASFRGWVLQLARRRVANLWRRARRLKRGGPLEPVADGSAAELLLAQIADGREARQSVVAECGELSDQIASAMARLPEKQRLVLQWRWSEELSFEEIAHRLGYTRAATARSLCFRARERLSESLPAGVEPRRDGTA